MAEMSVKIGPYRRFEVVTPHDTNAQGSLVTDKSDAIWVGGAGNLAVKMNDSTSAVTISGITAGSLLPISVNRVMSTNTTATNIGAFWR